MSSNFVRFQEFLNQAIAENFSCLTHKLANPPLKSGSSFPNRDPLLNMKRTKWPETEIRLVFSDACLKKSWNHLKRTYFWRVLALWSHCGSIGSRGAPHSALRHAIACSLAGNSEQHYIAYCCTERRSGDTFLVSCACQSLHCSQPRRLYTMYYILHTAATLSQV